MPGSARHAIPSGSTTGLLPGFHERNARPARSSLLRKSRPCRKSPSRATSPAGAPHANGPGSRWRDETPVDCPAGSRSPSPIAWLLIGTGMMKFQNVSPASAGNRVRPRRMQYQVRRPHRPPAVALWHGRGLPRRSGRSSLLHPFREQLDLRIREPALFLEFPVSGFRQPRRHESRTRDLDDLRRPLLTSS